MRFLHTADWQLGMTRHFLNGEAQPRYSAARRDAVAGLGALARARECGDARGEMASAQLLSNLSRSDGQTTVAAAWAAAASP